VRHAIDHLDRLVAACREPAGDALHGEPDLQPAAHQLRQGLDTARQSLRAGSPPPIDTLEAIALTLAEKRQTHRRSLLERTALGLEQPDAGVRQLNAMRWIERTVYHSWRAVHYLADDPRSTSPAVSEVEDEPEPAVETVP
jgi:phosphate:Na+ symporter